MSFAVLVKFLFDFLMSLCMYFRLVTGPLLVVMRPPLQGGTLPPQPHILPGKDVMSSLGIVEEDAG